MLDAGRAYRIAPNVSVDTEKLGGLVYRHDSRARYLLRSKPLADFPGEPFVPLMVKG